MSFHLLAYNNAGSTTANTDATPVTDNVVNIVNGHFFPQVDTRLIFASSMSSNLDRSRITQPSLRLITLPFIRPVLDSVIPASLDRVADYTANPMRIRGLEELGNEASLSTGVTRVTTLYGLQETYEAPPTGDVYTLRATLTGTAVANTWTTLTATWADQLPEGVYAVVGFDFIAANTMAARLIFSGQTWRPGTPAFATDTDIPDSLFHWGRLGTWGRFRQTDMPQVQTLANAGTTSHECYLQIVKVG